eukprot:TRINITY_DN9123_c0_g1_i1.p1 TRINITY_DN9123_c0_g1~~TRINITY_DN9123_c0_g1_i1.p1  ORF type:complete len:412 (-),score=39.23 TRINITY_DN9123_c0_g1_i1:9-1244(-)
MIINTEDLDPALRREETADDRDLELDPYDQPPDLHSKYRNLVAFFLLGLINNYGYVVFGSAATAILDGRAPVGVLLLCEILPGFLISGVGSWFLHYIPYVIRMWLVVTLSVVSFLIVAIWGSGSVFLALFGIVVGAFASGLGEPSFLALSSFYDKNTVSAWSSGTGFAGVFGSFTYLFYTYPLFGIQLSNSNTLFCMAPTPLIMAVAYLLILTPPKDNVNQRHKVFVSPTKHLTFMQKFKILQPLFIYMASLTIVYFAEYAINDGVQPALIYTNISISSDEQYTWYQFLYQTGVFLSRSSVNIFHTERVWIFALIQCVNLVILFLATWYWWFPVIYIPASFMFFEGFMGGFTYVNAFYAISERIDPRYREFAMSITVFADNLGIAVSAVVSIFLQQVLCKRIGNPKYCQIS